MLPRHKDACVNRRKGIDEGKFRSALIYGMRKLVGSKRDEGLANVALRERHSAKKSRTS